MTGWHIDSYFECAALLAVLAAVLKYTLSRPSAASKQYGWSVGPLKALAYAFPMAAAASLHMASVLMFDPAAHSSAFAVLVYAPVEVACVRRDGGSTGGREVCTHFTYTQYTQTILAATCQKTCRNVLNHILG